jgi:hypothetical protein
MATAITKRNSEHESIWFAIWLLFLLSCFMLLLQFFMHMAQTKDLQRRVGMLEQRIQTLTSTTTREGGK